MTTRSMSSSSSPPPPPPEQQRRRRPLVYTVEGVEGGPTTLHRLALPAHEEGRGRRSPWPAAFALAVVAAAASAMASPASRPAVAASAFLLLLLIRRLIRSRTVVAESILVVAGVGLQLQTHFADGREGTTQFLDLQRVRAVVINEGITMHRVVYYMTLLVEGKDKLVVAFPRLQPRLDELLPVYESLKRMIAAARAERKAAAGGRAAMIRGVD